MRNGTMFAELCSYESREFFEAHPTLHFDTLSEFGEYEVMYAFKTTAYSEDSFRYYLFTDAADAEEYDAFLRRCRELSLYDTGLTAAYGDRLLTLSTCEYSREDGRMVVVAKRILPPEQDID
jgi:sortase B